MSTQRINDLQPILKAMQQYHLHTGPADASLRQDRLNRAANLLREHRHALADAMNADFGNRSIYQSMAADIGTTIHGLRYAAEHVADWMRPETVAAPVPGMQARIERQPLGVVGIISPWNFPLNLAFGPLAGVLAAGNTALIKPSELTPRTSDLLAELIARYFDPMEVGVVLGDAETGVAFSQLPFDHLVFTGSTTVGRHVMRAAAENLVPVTLELGGKSPVVVHPQADMSRAIARTLTVKTFNAGQICLAPDYMLVAADKQAELIRAAEGFMRETFPSIQNNPDYTSIISARHYDRLLGLLDDAKAKGARVISLNPANEVAFDAATRKIAPHLVLDVTDEMLIMQEEIFGPLLPVKTCSSDAAAIAYINAHPRPLAAYYFGDDVQSQQLIATQTASGALVINDIMSHVAIETLPFGGVGPSGMGAYHGIHGFMRFTHNKPVVVQSPDGETNLRLRAPYADKLAHLETLLGA
ncbi:coniferyl aldehyde dehydrogenase [Pokkaliibacter sp. MBI-7]|uniref:coniferyl aldehyde dehydrogenase n=1 Tax=Pokkaliibacter sp. MBI-7 TaxID=3040600 RepID=UPI002449C6E4|nr:coniferyl aldehyde dehydrogenase [Pokkaliibacter sp. MBI-7]MDH2435413.1 coniferyl aldehyde dehydrogenase [Pokkaliibacter sp. MBI-7]